MSEHNNGISAKNSSQRRFGMVCGHCNAFSYIDLDETPKPKSLKLDDEKHLHYAFERIQHMRITLKLCRGRLSKSLLADDELQRTLDSHVRMVEQSYHHLSELMRSNADQFHKPLKGLVEVKEL